MKKLTIIISVILLSAACEKTIQVDFPDGGRKIVLNSISTTDSCLYVILTKSKHILETSNEFQPINGATVMLFENGLFVETGTELFSGTYFFYTKAVGGNTYAIEASSAVLNTVYCKSVAPFAIAIDSLNVSVKTTTDEYGSIIKRLDFLLRFQDNPSEKNYYIMYALQKENIAYIDQMAGDTFYYENTYPLYLETLSPTNTIWFEVNDFNSYGGSALILDDVTFNGKEFNTPVFSENNYYYHDPDGIKKTMIYFYLVSINKDLYNYYLSYQKYMDVRGDPLAEPVKVYSNINNGFGIFGGKAVAKDSIQVIYD